MIQFEKEWKKIYFTPINQVNNRDLHQEFADSCGITRQEAKELCYKNMFQPQTPWLLKTMINIDLDIYKEK